MSNEIIVLLFITSAVCMLMTWNPVGVILGMGLVLCGYMLGRIDAPSVKDKKDAND